MVPRIVLHSNTNFAVIKYVAVTGERGRGLGRIGHWGLETGQAARRVSQAAAAATPGIKSVMCLVGWVWALREDLRAKLVGNTRHWQIS